MNAVICCLRRTNRSVAAQRVDGRRFAIRSCNIQKPVGAEKFSLQSHSGALFSGKRAASAVACVGGSGEHWQAGRGEQMRTGPAALGTASGSKERRSERRQQAEGCQCATLAAESSFSKGTLGKPSSDAAVQESQLFTGPGSTPEQCGLKVRTSPHGGQARHRSHCHLDRTSADQSAESAD